MAGDAAGFAGCPQLNESAADLDLMSESHTLGAGSVGANIDVEGNGCCDGEAATGDGAGAGCPNENPPEEPCVEAGSPNPNGGKEDGVGVTVGCPKEPKDDVAATGAAGAVLGASAAGTDVVGVPNGAKAL